MIPMNIRILLPVNWRILENFLNATLFLSVVLLIFFFLQFLFCFILVFVNFFSFLPRFIWFYKFLNTFTSFMDIFWSCWLNFKHLVISLYTIYDWLVIASVGYFETFELYFVRTFDSNFNHSTKIVVFGIFIFFSHEKNNLELMMCSDDILRNF